MAVRPPGGAAERLAGGRPPEAAGDRQPARSGILSHPTEAALGDQLAAILRGQIAGIVAGSIFLFVGVASCAIGAFRRRSGAGIFVWLGAWSAMYGAMRFCDSSAVLAASPGWFRTAAPFIGVVCAYLLLVPAVLAFVPLTRGAVRLLLRATAGTGLVVGVVGVGAFVATGSRSAALAYNNLLARCILVVLVVVIVVPRLASRFLAFDDALGVPAGERPGARRVLMAGTFVFAVEAFYNNTARPLGLTPNPMLDHLGFAALLFSLAYAALAVVLANERRLLAVDQELEVARKIQLATLPRDVPDVRGLQISASYRPMTAVAGDFYAFIRPDAERIGILVADATGHGVPAALLASMIKVAVQAVTPCAESPAAVLTGLNRLLSGQSPGQLISAAYLWVDAANRVARYSAAGHPPLLRWSPGRLDRIDSNGFLLGLAGDATYPVADVVLEAGDRFLMYTDGVTDVENARGEFFGDDALEATIRAHDRKPPTALSQAILSAVERWRPVASRQQDDMTLIVVDVG